MTAGMPGTGIGGLFYLTAALLLPLRGVARMARGLHNSWPTILQQAGLALAIGTGIWATGWMIGFILGPVGTAQAAMQAGVASVPRFQSILRWAALLAGLGTLAIVLLLVQFARLASRLKAR
jgi:hypothetical protein